MKINDSIKNPVSQGADKAAAERSGAVKLESGAGEKAEKSQAGARAAGNVTLSPRAAQLQSLEAEVAASNVFDTKKVDAIKSAIASGQLKVNSEKVADGLIETVRDLLTTKKT
jgi:negative regulator of flagellin synthesis FlgM